MATQEPPERPQEPPQERPENQPQNQPQQQGGQQPGWGSYGTPPGAQGPPTGQQGPPAKPPQKPIYRRAWFVILAIVVALVVIGSMLGDDSTTGDTASDGTTAAPQVTEAPSEPAPEAPEAAGIGNQVRDGKFGFTVSKVECGKKRVGSADFGTSAQGQFCFVYLKVENVGKEAQTLDGSNQFMFGDSGQRYDADTEAAIYLDDSQSFLEEINPGNSVDGIVVFDIPKGAKPTKLELHDSIFSGGVEVKL